MSHMETKSKEFRDPVHGYISVPAEFCSTFIDNPIFQRLRHIEQTSMRPLYPSARHDRFVHSLGVFHLAQLAFQSLKANTNPALLSDIDWERYNKTFLVAALMHDCAHSCYSHTFEDNYKNYGDGKNFLFELVDKLDDKSFRADYPQKGSAMEAAGEDSSAEDTRKEPKAHEIFSAAVFLQHFRSRCSDSVDPILVARMITGVRHHSGVSQVTRVHQFENCLIDLLNGPAIDIDKLDYIIRDTWSSGVNNVSIDVRRLLSSLEIIQNNSGALVVSFRQSALSVLQSVLDGREFLYRWIYSHHTVRYYERLLKNAVEELNRRLGETPNAFFSAVFSRNAFSEPHRVGDYYVYLPCDDDIHYILKAEHAKQPIPQVEEILSRRPTRIPLWKTQVEFENIFRESGRERISFVQANASELLQSVLGEQPSKEVLVVKVMPSEIDLEERHIWVKLQGKPVLYSKIIQDLYEGPRPKVRPFFYVYVPRVESAKVSQCITRLVG